MALYSLRTEIRVENNIIPCTLIGATRSNYKFSGDDGNIYFINIRLFGTISAHEEFNFHRAKFPWDDAFGNNRFMLV